MSISVFQQVLKQIPRRQFQSIVARHEGDKWVKSFSCWQQLVAMVYAQLSGQTSLRDLEASFNAAPQRHYQLGGGPIKRSTLSEANAKRPLAIFEELLRLLLARLDARPAREAENALRILDSTVISLSAKSHRWAAFRVNNAAIKLHLVFDPDAQCPTFFEIAPARLHDQTLAWQVPIEPKASYVFDRAYIDAGFWAKLDEAGCRFVTRAKSNLLLEELQSRIDPTDCIFQDDIVRLEGRGKDKYPKPLRRIVYFDEERAKELTFLTNDMQSPASDIAALYKRRWQIELFFKWIKQNLELKRFMAKNPKAVRLQIITALIAFVALKLLHHAIAATAPLKRLKALCKNNLFNQNELYALINPKPPEPPNQTAHQLVMNFPGQW